MIHPNELLGWRNRALDLLDYACAGEYPVGSERYLEITEGRHGKGYSSCGDLAHWLYYRLGFGCPWVNREANGGWRCGHNVSLLVSQSEPYAGGTLYAGDVIIIANEWPSGRDAHVVCIREQLSRDMLLTSESGLPGNGNRLRELPMKRKIRVVLPLARILEQI